MWDLRSNENAVLATRLTAGKQDQFLISLAQRSQSSVMRAVALALLLAAATLLPAAVAEELVEVGVVEVGVDAQHPQGVDHNCEISPSKAHSLGQAPCGQVDIRPTYPFPMITGRVPPVEEITAVTAQGALGTCGEGIPPGDGVESHR